MTPVYKSFNDASSPLSSIVETSFSKINNYVNGKKKVEREEEEESWEKRKNERWRF